jgi:hypothetical protein
MTAPRDLWIGSYPAQGSAAGSGEGVWQVEVGPDGSFGQPRFSAATAAPSFLALHPSGRTLYAVAEQGSGTVSAFPVLDDARLGAPVTISSGGDSPCHLLALDDVLWIANYGDGVAAAVRLDPKTGALADDAVTTFTARGSGPRADRQEGPHAHFCAAAGEGVLVVDLGIDAVRRYPARPWTPGDPLWPSIAAQLDAGAGPRHLVTLPGGSLVVAGELDGLLHVLAPRLADIDSRAGDAPEDLARTDGWAPSSSVRASVARAADGTPGFPSHVTLTGDLLLVGVRGTEVLAVHRVTEHADAPARVEHLADIGLGPGAWPRHHEVMGTAADGRLLVVVVLQGTSELASVLVDRATGAGEVAARLPFATPPACVLPTGRTAP